MKKGKLQKTGIEWVLILENNKSIKVPKHYQIEDHLNNVEVQYELNKTGQLISLYHNDKAIVLVRKDINNTEQKKDNTTVPGKMLVLKSKGGNTYNPNNVGEDSFATAPYNFIPLPEKIVPAPEVDLDFSSFQDGLLSGYIDLSIEAKTDLFIRGEMENFFSVKNRPTIPGSSIRGLIRSILEIISFSNISFVDGDRNLFYRNISEDPYKKIFTPGFNTGGDGYSIKGAWLEKKKGVFKLYEVPEIYRVDIYARHMNNFPDKECYATYHIWYDSNNIIERNNKKIIQDISPQKKEGLCKGVLLKTGMIPKKRYQWIFPDFNNECKLISCNIEDILDLYRQDRGRKACADLLSKLEFVDKVPCFILVDSKGETKYIGHTGFFRIPYENKIKSAIPNYDSQIRDISKSIFGFIDGEDEKLTSGRVYFEDCIIHSTDITYDEAPLKILSSPKPTSYQLYLEQNGAQKSHWDSENPKIRGQKVYWHRIGENWKNGDVKIVGPLDDIKGMKKRAFEDAKAQFTVAKVIKKGAFFSGRIRFDNLHPIELGALLSALKLPDECAHKIGMGKPYGMGSIRIKPKLTIINRKNRYKNIFNTFSDGFTRISTGSEEGDISYYINLFAGYLCDMIGNTSVTNRDWGHLLKNNERLKELYVMLLLEPNGNNKNSWEEQTRYMQISRTEANGRRTNEFKTRKNLRRPSSHL